MKKRFALVLLVAIVVSQALSQTFAVVQTEPGIGPRTPLPPIGGGAGGCRSGGTSTERVNNVC